MKLGVSSYSLLGAIQSNQLSIVDCIQWIADKGGDHIELVPMGYTLTDNPELVEAILAKSKETS